MSQNKSDTGEKTGRFEFERHGVHAGEWSLSLSLCVCQVCGLAEE